MDVEIILLQDDPKLGKRGQVVKAAKGHAYNYLIPNGRARVATPDVLRVFEAEKTRRLKSETERKTHAEALAAQLKDMTLTLEMPAGEGGKLYGAVTAQDIVNALAAKGIATDKKDLHLPEPIRKLGAYPVTVKSHPEVSVVFRVSVMRKNN